MVPRKCIGRKSIIVLLRSRVGKSSQRPLRAPTYLRFGGELGVQASGNGVQDLLLAQWVDVERLGAGTVRLGATQGGERAVIVEIREGRDAPAHELVAAHELAPA